MAVCHSTKLAEAEPLENKEAAAVAEFLFRSVFPRYGFVRYMITDRGRESRNSVAEILALKMGVFRRFTTPYRPQGDGTAERTAGVATERLAQTIKKAPESWDEVLPARPLRHKEGARPESVLPARCANGDGNVEKWARGIPPPCPTFLQGVCYAAPRLAQRA